MAKRPGSAGDPLWYKDATIYELHVRAFKDSNRDGIGDFPGLIQKLDYLQDLGGHLSVVAPLLSVTSQRRWL
jgi:maltose alpha-D-glucosyltransferase/alpha-amylase